MWPVLMAADIRASCRLTSSRPLTMKTPARRWPSIAASLIGTLLKTSNAGSSMPLYAS